ncbi:GNAT family N-acetyltransferase [Yoonia sp. 208BN28-4]|uniref:GNAT family N-acetyltransferase n=1 Tax=Yoonia sp. 208BN28-4 TaxID=3126505 RepID=UPI0030AB25D4
MKHAVLTTGQPLQQHPTFAAALHHCGVIVENEGCIITAQDYGPLGQLRLVTRGPAWHPDPAARLADYQALRDHKVRILNAEHGDPALLKAAGFRQIMTPATIAERHLSDPDLADGMQQKWRNRWRKAENNPPRVQHRGFRPAQDGWLLDADAAQQKAKRFRNYPRALTSAYVAQGADASRLFIAHSKDGPAAALLFLHHKPRATYHIGWANTEARKSNWHALLMTHAMTYYQQHGYACLDLGRIDTLNAPHLARFKLGSGAVARPLGGTWLRLGL